MQVRPGKRARAEAGSMRQSSVRARQEPRVKARVRLRPMTVVSFRT